MEPRARWSTFPRGWRAGVLTGLALLFVGMGLAQARSDSLTVDEAPDIAGGLAAVERHDVGVTPEHGLLPRVSFGLLPALLADPIVPDDRSGDWFAVADETVAANEDAGRLDDVLFWARVPALLVGLLAALAIHVLAARWSGPDAALLAAGAWLTTPLVVGVHHLASIDPATALAVLLLVVATVRLVEAPSDRRVAVAGVALGGLLLCRHSGAALGVVPLGAAVVTATATRDRVRRALVVAVAAVAVVWIGYRAVDPTGPDGVVRDRQQALVDAAADESAVARLTSVAPLPLEWRAGFAWLTISSDPKVSSALGQRWEGSRWWYYPVSLPLASPPLTLALLGLAPLALAPPALARLRRPAAPPGDAARPEAARPDAPSDAAARPEAAGEERGQGWSLGVVGASVVLVLGPLLVQPLQLGPRLMLPVLALALVLGADVVRRVAGWSPVRRRVAVGVAAALAIVQLALVVGSGPSSFGWTPPGLRPEHRWAGTQATDIAQDRDRLADWVAQHDDEHDDDQDDEPIAGALLLPLGQELPDGVADLRDVPRDELTGWVVVSVSALVTFGPDLDWLRAYCNIDSVGRSILVYRFAEPPERSAGPDLPVAACTGDEVSRRRST